MKGWREGTNFQRVGEWKPATAGLRGMHGSSRNGGGDTQGWGVCNSSPCAVVSKVGRYTHKIVLDKPPIVKWCSTAAYYAVLSLLPPLVVLLR